MSTKLQKAPAGLAKGVMQDAQKWLDKHESVEGTSIAVAIAEYELNKLGWTLFHE